ncbi:hypothetical protein ACNO5E_13065, partial [Vibrio parahaemolyticus]
VSDFFYHSSVFSRGMPTKKNKTTLSNQLDISRLQGKKIKTAVEINLSLSCQRPKVGNQTPGAEIVIV